MPYQCRPKQLQVRIEGARPSVITQLVHGDSQERADRDLLFISCLFER